MIYRLSKYFSLVLIGLVMCSSMALAQDISVIAEVNTNVIPLGSAAQLSITVKGAQNADPVQIPAIDGLQIQYHGP